MFCLRIFGVKAPKIPAFLKDKELTKAKVKFSRL